MRLLVTGREGQVSRALREAAADIDGIDLVALGRPELDLEKPGTIGPAVKHVAPDVIISAAAYTAVDKAEEEPERAHRVNAEGPGALAMAAAAAGARIIHLSTDYVFDGSGEGARAETDPVAPLGVYGRTKLAGEEAVRAACPDHLILRTAWIYSPYGRNFLKTMMALAETRDEVRVVADQWGNPTAAADIAAAIFAIIAAWRDGARTGLGHTYHLAGSGDASWHGFAAHIFALLAKAGAPSANVIPIASADYPTPARRPANSRLDSSRFARDFGYRAPDWRVSTERTVARLVDRP